MTVSKTSGTTIGGFFLLVAMLGFASLAQAKENCTDLSGDYRIEGKGNVLLEALTALDAKGGDPIAMHIRLKLDSNGVLKVWKSAAADIFPSEPSVTFFKGKKDHRGIVFTCNGDVLVLGPVKPVNRDAHPRQLRGQSMIHLQRTEPYGDLGITAVFSGRAVVSIFSYDSANIDFTLPFTTKTLNESVTWVDVTRKFTAPMADASRPAHPIEPQESSGEVTVKKWLTKEVVGPLNFSGLTPRKNGSVVATFTTRSKDDYIAFQARLQKSVVIHAFENPPIWTNGQYWFEVVFTLPH